MMQPVNFQEVGWRQVGWQWRGMRRAQRNELPDLLALAWPYELSDDGVLHSARGADPTFTDTPTLSAGGVVPGDGPAFHYDPCIWRVGDTIYVRWTATVASADVVDDVELIDPVYIRAGYLVAKDGTNEAVVSTSWEIGDVVTGVVQVDGDVMRCGRVE